MKKALNGGYLQKIFDNSVRSNHILRSLFMYSKLESAGYTLHVERADLCEFTRQIAAEYIPEFEEKGFRYALSVPDEELFVHIDAGLFRRVYDNLIENAIKYNEAGTEISFTISQNEIAGKSCAEITIADNGIGIAEEHMDRIFQPFFRADQNAVNSDGSGLELTIVQKIVTLHGGEIIYTGDETGCRWLIRIPLAD